MNRKKLDQVAKGLLSLGGVEHKRPKEPTKEELNKRFVLRVGKAGNLNMEEIK